MKNFKLTYLITFLFLFSVGHSQIADKIYSNAKIYTSNDAQPFAEAMAVKDGKIIFIGTNAAVAAHNGSGTLNYNVQGRLILPGMHDVHMHPLEASSSISSSCGLNSAETNPENFIPVMQACNATPNANGWVLGFGHSIYTLLAATRDPKLILDQVYPTTPAAYMEETSHSFWVNSAGLAALGMTSVTPDPVGGHIVKNAAGQPNGILLDAAGDLILEMTLPASTYNDNQNYEGLAYYGLPLLARNGITSICEGRTYWKRNFIPIWQRLKNENLLTTRVVLAPWVYPADINATQIPQLQALYNAGDDMLKVTQIKLYSDGIIINATAGLKTDYNDNLGFPFTKGLRYISEVRMTELITTLEQTGFDFHIHGIGDAGIKSAVNSIQAARTANGEIGARHRITHLEIVDPADYGLFAPLNIITDMQVTGDFTNPANWHDNDPLIGVTRSNNLVPLKSIYNTGAKVTLSSDWDVSSLSPFVGIQNSLTRVPQELPNVATAVKCYTINGAFVMRNETKTGSLEVNKYADFIIVDRDIFTIATTDIKNTTVLMTQLEGNIVYTQTGFVLGNEDFNTMNSQILIYPNIAKDTVNIDFSNLENDEYTISVYDIKGSLIDEVDFYHNHEVSKYLLDVSDYEEGMYIVNISTSEFEIIESKKIIVSN